MGFPTFPAEACEFVPFSELHYRESGPTVVQVKVILESQR